MAGPWKKPLWGGPLTLEKYHRFFVDPWGASITNDQLNHVRALPNLSIYSVPSFI
jgi:hypothetical protein